jgi:phage/plasmid-like protein (TIGR03299 family)
MAWIRSEDTMARAKGTARSWHGEEIEIESDASLDEWRKVSGLDFTVEQTPLYAKRGADLIEVTDKFAMMRGDVTLGIFSGRYKPVQPKQIGDFFQKYVLADSRFKMDTMGAVKGGRVIWALAKFHGEHGDTPTIMGQAHELHALLATSYDGTMATRGGACATRTVCRNTLQAAAYEPSVITIRHSADFAADGIQKQAAESMAKIAESFDGYKAFAESLAMQKMSLDQTHAFLKTLVGVDANASGDDVSARTFNIVDDLMDSLSLTMAEPGTDELNAWTALNAVTRYVDHARSTKRTVEGESAAEARLFAAQFGSGAQMKAKAVALLQAA